MESIKCSRIILCISAVICMVDIIIIVISDYCDNEYYTTLSVKIIIVQLQYCLFVKVSGTNALLFFLDISYENRSDIRYSSCRQIISRDNNVILL